MLGLRLLTSSTIRIMEARLSPAADSSLICRGRRRRRRGRRGPSLGSASSLDRKTYRQFRCKNPTKDDSSAQHDSVTKIALLSIDCDNSRISTRCYHQFVQKRFWGSAHRCDAQKIAGSRLFVQSGLHSIISYSAFISSNASLDATIVVVIAKGPS
jgi:hypothetical protein